MPQHLDGLQLVELGAFMRDVAAVRTNHADHGGEQGLMLLVVFLVDEHRMGRAGMEGERQVVKQIASGLAVGDGHMVQSERRIRLEEERVLLFRAFDFTIEL